MSIFLPVWWEALQEKAISLFCLGLSVHVSRLGTIYLTFQSEAARLNSYSLFWRNVIAVECSRLVWWYSEGDVIRGLLCNDPILIVDITQQILTDPEASQKEFCRKQRQKAYFPYTAVWPITELSEHVIHSLDELCSDRGLSLIHISEPTRR